MLVLLSDPALPGKAPRRGVGRGCLPPSSAAAPRRDPRAQSELGRGSSVLRGQGQIVGGAPRPRGAGPEYLRRERDAASRPRGLGAAAVPSESVGAAAGRHRAGLPRRRGRRRLRVNGRRELPSAAAPRERARLSARSGALQRAAALAADGTFLLRGDTRRRGSAEPATCRFLPGSVKHTPLRTDSECKEPCLFKRDAAFLKSNSTMYVANRVGKQLTYGCCA